MATTTETTTKTATANELGLELTPPEPVPMVVPEKASGLVAIDSEKKSALEQKVDGFVAEYERARGESFDGAEREVMVAAQRWISSYGARSQHSDHVCGLFPDVDHTKGWPRLLHELLDRTDRPS